MTLGAIQVLHNAMEGGGCQLSPEKVLQMCKVQCLALRCGWGSNSLKKIITLHLNGPICLVIPSSSALYAWQKIGIFTLVFKASMEFVTSDICSFHWTGPANGKQHVSRICAT